MGRQPFEPDTPDRLPSGENKLEGDGQGQPEAQNRPALLPPDLPKALAWLTDTELETLAQAIRAELARRARVRVEPAPVELPKKRAISRRTILPAKASQSPTVPVLTTSIRAAFKAGVRPSIIARQFGVTPAMIRDAIAEMPR